MAARGGAHREVLELGLEVEHLGQRHPLGAAAVLDQQHLLRHVGQRAAPLLQRALRLLQRLLQALGPHRLGQVVDRLELEGRHGMGRMGGDEHHRRRAGALAQAARQLDAVDAGHVDVEQHQVEVGREQLRLGVGAVGGLGHHLGPRRVALGQQRAQPRPGQRFVVDDQGAQKIHGLLIVSDRNGDAHAVGLLVHAGAELRLHVVQQPQPVAHVGQRDAVAARQGLVGPAQRRQAVDHLDHRHAAAALGADADLRALRAGLDAMLDRVLDQRLQQQRRQARAVGRGVDVPADAQPVAEAHLLDRQVALGQRDLVGQGDRFARVGQRVAEQLAQVFQHGLGLGRLLAHQRDRAVERVEQEVRADARLQLFQPRRRGRRRLPARAQHQRGHHQRREHRAGQGAGDPGRAGRARPSAAAGRSRRAPASAPSDDAGAVLRRRAAGGPAAS